MSSKVRTSNPVVDAVKWSILKPLAWKLAGARDQAATRKANKSRDVVR